MCRMNVIVQLFCRLPEKTQKKPASDQGDGLEKTGQRLAPFAPDEPFRMAEW